MDDFFPAALAKLREAGFREEQIETRTDTTLLSVGETILEAAREGGFGAIVMGRRGINKSFFGGKVSYSRQPEAFRCGPVAGAVTRVLKNRA